MQLGGLLLEEQTSRDATLGDSIAVEPKHMLRVNTLMLVQ